MTISGLCKLTVIADKPATVQSTVETKTCLSLILCCIVHEHPFCTLGNAMVWDVVKRFANQNRVNCLFDMIGQLDMLSFYRTEKSMCFRHRELSGTKKTRRCLVLGRSAKSLVVSLLSDQLAQPQGTVNAS